MNRTPSQFDELADLVWALANGRLDAEGESTLRRMLESDAANRRIYIELMDQFALLEWEGAERDAEELKEKEWEPVPHPILSPLPTLSTTHYPLPANFIGGPVFSYMVATVVLCLMLLGAWAYKISHVPDMDVVDNSRRSTTSGPSKLVFVGIITGMNDCRWSDPDTQTVVGASVPLDRQYALASGLLEITYTNGAKVILEGPCTYKVDSDVGGYLERGKLTARIDSAKPQAANPEPRTPNPESRDSSFFAVRTPTALVTDLGTEFGVDVKKNGETQVHVFEGKVEAEWFGSNGAVPRKMILTAGQAAGFSPQDTSVTLFSVQPQDFTRVIATATGPLRNVALKKTIIKWSGVYRYGDPTKGTDDWTTWDRFGVWHVNDGITDEAEQGNAYWKGRERTPDEYFVIYLAGKYDIQRIELVNTHNSTGNDRGTKDFEIWAADDINQYKDLVSPRLVLKGTLPCRFGAGAEIPCDVFSAERGDFERFNARYVKFVAKTYYEGENFGGCGLNEIRLFALPATDTN